MPVCQHPFSGWQGTLNQLINSCTGTWHPTPLCTACHIRPQTPCRAASLLLLLLLPFYQCCAGGCGLTCFAAAASAAACSSSSLLMTSFSSTSRSATSRARSCSSLSAACSSQKRRQHRYMPTADTGAISTQYKREHAQCSHSSLQHTSRRAIRSPCSSACP